MWKHQGGLKQINKTTEGKQEDVKSMLLGKGNKWRRYFWPMTGFCK